MKVHHVGTVVASVAEATVHFTDLGFRTEGGIVEDPIQKVRIQFMRGEGAGLRIELLEPLGSDSPVSGALSRGGGVTHVCYEVDDMVAAVEARRAAGAVLVSGPVPAPAISGARVAFLVDRHQGLFELVEAPAPVPAAGGAGSGAS